MTLNKWLSIALFLSLALNVFAAGVLVGDKRHRMGKPSPAQFHELSPEGQAAITQIWQAHRGDMQTHRSQHRRAHRALRKALTATPYDEEAVLAAQARMAEVMGRARTLHDEAVLKSARQLSDEDRAIFLRSLPRPPMGPPKGERGHRTGTRPH